MKKRSTKLFLILAAVLVLTYIILEEIEVEVSINGVVCNHSSTGVWLAVSEGQRTRTSSLAPGQCTNFFREDVEAIWGKACSTDACGYQAWKLGAGRFVIYDDTTSPSGSVLRIEGWGAGSSWHITGDWPKPELSSIGYSLVK
jgi:hypothetical protein